MAKINIRTSLFLMVVLISIVVCEKVEEDDCVEVDCGTCLRVKTVQPNDDNEDDYYFTCTKCSEKFPYGKTYTNENFYPLNKAMGELNCTRDLSTGGIIGIVLGVVSFFVIIGGGVFAYYKCRNMNKGNNRIQNTETGGDTQNMQNQQPNNKKNQGTGKLDAGGNLNEVDSMNSWMSIIYNITIFISD